ncbi:S8 family serine peptidase [Aerophototrophica crusticola]
MDYSKIAPGTFTAIEHLAPSGSNLPGAAKMLGMVASSAGSPKTLLFLRTHEHAEFSQMPAHGITINQNSGRIRTAICPIEKIGVLASHPGVKFIYPSVQLKPKMDRALKLINFPSFQVKTNLTGKGVIIGIVDSGIDGRHPMFDGRIEAVWDQTIPGITVAEGDYGHELTGHAISKARDENGHGTHVAGIAAGAHLQYQGVAPEAKLVIVKTDFQNAHIADGIRYIFRVAKSLGMPAVVNLSLGGHFDAHDGTDALSELINDVSGPGRLVCCAAGNEGDDDIHALTELRGHSPDAIQFRLQSNGNTPAEAVLNCWYGGSEPLELAIESPIGQVTPWFSADTSATGVETLYLAANRIIIDGRRDIANGDYQVLISILPSSIQLGTVWRLHLRNRSSANVKVHMWAMADEGNVTFRPPHAYDGFKIGSPGSASSAITVASITSRDSWTDITNTRRSSAMPLGAISPYSSPGPLRNGKLKPDLAAPGAFLISAMSAQSGANVDDSYKIDTYLRANAGTSMACPVITGLCGLLLQRDRMLDPYSARRLLTSAVSPMPGFDRRYGFGIIDAAAL